jgi:hypothetical protein
MPLTLLDPSTAAVVHYASGVISVRLADYVAAGPTTTSDALAAAGTCVVDDQEIAVHTTMTGGGLNSRFALAADTAVIPISDLSVQADGWYELFVSLRMTGALPSTAWYLHAWASIDAVNSKSAGVTYGLGAPGSPSYAGAVRSLPTALFPHYMLRSIDSGIFFPFDADPDNDELVIRAWGVDGGTSAWRLDTLYLVLYGENGETALYNQLYFNDHILDLRQNGNLDNDADEDATDLPFGGGKFSILKWQIPWFPDALSQGALAEMQIGDLEPTGNNMQGFGTLDTDPKTRLVIPCGASFIPGPEELMVDDFTFGQGTHVTYGAWFTADIGKDWLRTLLLGGNSTIMDWWDFPTNSIRGTWVMPPSGPTIDPAEFGPGTGEGWATTFFGDSTGNDPGIFPGNELPDGTFGWYGGLRYGADNLEGGFSASLDATDPSLRRKLYQPDGLETFVATSRYSMLDFAGDGGVTLGIETYDNDGRGMCANLIFNSGSTVELQLVFSDNTSVIGPYHVVDGPVTLAGSWSLGDWFWVKVEKRGYYWRARAWADGDTEPSTWDVEGYQPFVKLTTGTGWIDYPYDDEWVAGGASNDTVRYDPRGGPGGLADTGWLMSYHYAARLQPKMRILQADFSAYYVPEDADPTDMHIRVEKYDGSVDYGSETIPYGAHRFVESNLDYHTFDADENGINVSLWKEAGAPDWQVSSGSRIFMIAPYKVLVDVSLVRVRFPAYNVEVEEEG